MADIKNITSEIRKGKNIDKNLPDYVKYMASVYGEFSLYNLSMLLSMQVDRSEEEGTAFNKHNQECYDAVIKHIKSFSGEFNAEANKLAIAELLGVRDTVKKRMDAVTAIVDRLIIYEYMLNRLEPEFERIPTETTSNDELAKEILRWIFKDEENGLINDRIKTAITCLPIRFTKGKIMDMVDATFTLYRGSEKRAIDMFDYMLRSCTGLWQVEDKYNIYKNVNELLEELEKGDYSGEDARTYYELKDSYRLGANLASELADELTDIEDIINATLAVLLTREYFSENAVKRSKKALDILDSMLSEKDNYDILFEGIEGRVEELNENITEQESVLDFVEENQMGKIEELSLDVPFARLLMVRKLCGDSSFADLAEDTAEVEEGYLEEVRSKFIGDLGDLFQKGNRLKNRAIMAQLLRELPVTMSSPNEVMDYVRTAISASKDLGERQISMNLIRECYD